MELAWVRGLGLSRDGLFLVSNGFCNLVVAVAVAVTVAVVVGGGRGRGGGGDDDIWTSANRRTRSCSAAMSALAPLASRTS